MDNNILLIEDFALLPYNYRIIEKNGMYYGFIEEFGRDSLVEAETLEDLYLALEDIKLTLIEEYIVEESYVPLPSGISLEEAINITQVLKSNSLYKLLQGLMKKPIDTINIMQKNKRLLELSKRMYKDINNDPFKFADEQLEKFEIKYKNELSNIKESNPEAMTRYRPINYFKNVRDLMITELGSGRKWTIKGLFLTIMAVSETLLQASLFVASMGRYGFTETDLKSLEKRLKQISRSINGFESIKDHEPISSAEFAEAVRKLPFISRILAQTSLEVFKNIKLIGFMMSNIITSFLAIVLTQKTIVVIIPILLKILAFVFTLFYGYIFVIFVGLMALIWYKFSKQNKTMISGAAPITRS